MSEEEDLPGDFHDVHQQPLPSQGSIYTLSKLLPTDSEDEQGHERRVYLLSSTLNRRSFALQCQTSALGVPRISTKEIHFTYIPSGAEIISMDAFRRRDLNDFVVGITIIIKPEDGASSSSGRFFNIYNDDLPLEESLAHNCQSLELDFIPYQLTHAPLSVPQGPNVWLLSGSDARIHPYAYEPEAQVYNIVPLCTTFPELEEEEDGRSSVIMWMDIAYIGSEFRLTATGREDGRLRVTKWDLNAQRLLDSWVNETMEDPITSLRFFTSLESLQPEDSVRHKLNISEGTEYNLVVLHALSEAQVFHSLLTYGLDKVRALKNSHSHDVPTCVLSADVDFSGSVELLLGTYGQVILCYKESGSEWVPQRLGLSSRRFPGPVLNLDYIDLSGDGIKDLVVLTTKALHILQIDRMKVLQLLKKKLEKIA
eukprot:TRINITY_DN7782_c0_g1_i1.p1 TRINITY_DN7782_c0_g1~~TRINITY_DN7782_c0_g1_i1.p1  ORF type:complete len:425 (-),score=103.37 TRINITY_DN7782_c0_g1_i1:473-1747(-)